LRGIGLSHSWKKAGQESQHQQSLFHSIFLSPQKYGFAVGARIIFLINGGYWPNSSRFVEDG
jgi:hypothetical protein